MTPIRDIQWDRFIEVMEQSGSPTLAAKNANISRKAAYDRRDRDPEFARRWEEALQAGYDVVELALRQRAVEGYEEPVFHGGQQVGVVRRFSDSNGQFLLRGYRPERFRDRLEVSGQIDIASAILQRRQRALLPTDAPVEIEARVVDDVVCDQDELLEQLRQPAALLGADEGD
jgi:hypothetical protein